MKELLNVFMELLFKMKSALFYEVNPENGTCNGVRLQKIMNIYYIVRDSEEDKLYRNGFFKWICCNK